MEYLYSFAATCLWVFESNSILVHTAVRIKMKLNQTQPNALYA